MRPTRVEIDLAAIRHNLSQIRIKVGPDVKIIAAPSLKPMLMVTDLSK